MIKKFILLAFAAALSLCLCGCLEQQQTTDPAVDETGHSDPIPDISVVSNGSLSAVVVGKGDDGIVLEITNSGNENTINATFTSVKIGGQEYEINQADYESSPLSIVRDGESSKTINLNLAANDFVRLKVSSSELSSADDYNNVDLTFNETYMGDNGSVTKTNRSISIKNA
jgi:hypothetical protein